MGKRTFIYIGVILGGIGTVGEILMLLMNAKGGNVGVLVFWMLVLAVSLYYMNKDQKTIKN